jgi:hypothetical protein
MRLREDAKHLNSLTDAANRVLSIIEKFLLRTDVGVHSTVPIDKTRSLTFFRGNSSYRIGLVVDRQFKPWTECSREEKIVMAARAEDLVNALLDEVHRQATGLPDSAVVKIAQLSVAVNELEGADEN